MRRSFRLLAFSALVVASSAAGLLACSSDDSDHPVGDGVDGSIPRDASPEPTRGDGSTSVPTPPDASGLSAACVTSSDCQLVDEPTSCQETVCSCPSLAINADAAAAWSIEVTSYAAACRAAAGDGGLEACGVDCINIQPLCCAGSCVVVTGSPGATCPGSTDAGADASGDAAPADASADAHDAD